MIDEQDFTAYFNALLTGDAAVCGDTVSRLLERDILLTDLYTHLFQRSLYRVGRLWETNRISVAVEHLATALTEKMIAMVYPKILSAGAGGCAFPARHDLLRPVHPVRLRRRPADRREVRPAA